MRFTQSFAASICLSFCSSLLALAQATKLAPELASLVEAERAFAQYSVENGQREAFLKFFAEEGVAFNPRPFNSNEYLRPQPPTPKPQPFILNWQPLFADISAAGDMGFTTGPYTVVAANRPTRHGMYFSVWKKQADKTVASRSRHWRSHARSRSANHDGLHCRHAPKSEACESGCRAITRARKRVCQATPKRRRSASLCPLCSRRVALASCWSTASCGR